MATLNWSTLASGTYAFNPNADVLNFDVASIHAADVGFFSSSGTADSLFYYNGKTVILQTSAHAVTTTNVTFADGSRIVMGDNTTNTVNDDANNTLNGTSGNDILIGAGGNDTMNGNGGNDVFQIAPNYTTGAYGNDTMNGGAGFDRMFYNVTNGYGVNVNLATGVATGGDGLGSTLKLDSIEGVTGTMFSDTLTGNGSDNVLDGGAGNDTISGGAGNDTISGGAGNDSLAGGAGNDTLDGASGFDTAFYSGNKASYTITKTGSHVTVTGSGDGTDSLGHVEKLQFADGSMKLNTMASCSGQDFNGDGNGDLLFRNDSGEVGMSLANGGGIVGTGIVVPDAWSIAGAGDFNGDDKADILWRNDNGDVGMWLMNGSHVAAGDAKVLGVSVPNNWSIAGIGDFNGDSKADILWRNDSGAIGMWTMDGTSVVSVNTDLVGGNVPNNWSIAGIGDFNGDSKADILWRSDSGAIGMWTMDGTSAVSVNTDLVGGNVPKEWSIAGVADFNADNKADVLWRNDSGAVGMWTMDGTNVVSVNTDVVGGNVPNDWSIVGTGDVNGDHKADVLWQHTNGSTGVWQMNGAQVTDVDISDQPVPNQWMIS